jgi:hypothetical protein
MTRIVGRDDPEAKVQIQDARDLAEKYGLQGVMIMGIRRDGIVDSVTYGDHPAQKAIMGDIADGFLEPMAQEVLPYRTMFGIGNNGIPKRLSIDEHAFHNVYGFTDEEIEAQTHPDAID